MICCKACGGDLILVEGSSVAKCEFCGRSQTVPKVDDEKKMTLFARANRLRAACDFDKAAALYESIVAEHPQEAEAYWGLVLCRYGIEYVDDPATGQKISTCHRSSFNSILDDGDFEQVLENADLSAQRIYREEAKQFEQIRKGILEVSSSEKPYDIFICYKETDENGERTLDSVLAQDLYDALTNKGYRIFFSRITLRGKLGEAYEPYIFAALNSAKVMLAVGTCYEYYNAVWVKNEWSRYLKLCAADRSKHLIPCFKDLDPEDMPKEFKHLQGADLGKMGAIQDVLYNMEKYIPLKKVVQPVVQERVVVGGGGNNKIASLLDRGNMALEDGDWAKADSFFEDVLNNDSQNAQAYLGKTLAQEQCRTIDAFARKRKALYEHVATEKKYLARKSTYIEESVGRNSVPGCVEQDAIRKLYHFDLSYPSQLTDRKRQYQAEETFWANHKLLSRAEKFAIGAVAQNLAAEKQALFMFLSERVKKAESAENAARLKAQDAYDAHIQSADQKAEQMHENGIRYRTEYYGQLLQEAKCETDVQKLTDLAAAFDALQDYQDSKNLAQHCRNRIVEEQEKLAVEAERQKKIQEQQEAKLRARKKRKATMAVIAAVMVLVIGAASAFYIVNFLIPNNKLNQAISLLEEERHDEAVIVLKELGGDEKSMRAMAEQAQIFYDNGKYAQTITMLTTLQELRCGKSSMQNYVDQCVSFHQNWKLEEMEQDQLLLVDAYVATEEFFEAKWLLEDMAKCLQTERCIQRLAKLYYQWGDYEQQNGQFYAAALEFTKASDYEDAAQRAALCYYQAGLKELEEMDFKQAKSRFDLAGNYEDAAVLSAYCQARLLAEEDLFSAEEILRQLPSDLMDVSNMLSYIDTYSHWNKVYTCTSFKSDYSYRKQQYDFAKVLIQYRYQSYMQSTYLKYYLYVWSESGDDSTFVDYGDTLTEELLTGKSFSYVSGYPEEHDFWDEIKVTERKITLVEITDVSLAGKTTGNTYVFEYK